MAVRPVPVGMRAEPVASAEIAAHTVLEVWPFVAVLADNLRSTQK